MQRGFHRRTFLQGTAAISVAAAFQGLRPRTAASQSIPGPYGPLVPVNDETTGLPLLNLPAGFTYKSTGFTGDLLIGGIPTPPGHDGMAVVGAEGSVVFMVRNHEMRHTGAAFGDASMIYDPVALGGCSRLAFDTATGQWLPRRAFLCLSGTSTNCAGGPTPWGTWLTCEETLASAGDPGLANAAIPYRRDHGYVFEVAGMPGTTTNPKPLEAMGRFVHEATAVDVATGYVYETQDRMPAGLYRFIPRVAGHLARGGKLQMLAVAGRPKANLIGESSRIPDGTTFPAAWVPIAEPNRAHTDPAAGDGGGTFDQGFALGGAAFARLEGLWHSRIDGKIYVVSTSGGVAGKGQLWIYDDVAATLTMAYEAPDALTLNHPDNVTITPQGAILLCEDGGSVRDFFGNTLRQESLMGLANGRIFSFAENRIILTSDLTPSMPAGDYRMREWAGATFSPDGRWLFANIQTPGITFAITGPWANGPF